MDTQPQNDSQEPDDYGTDVEIGMTKGTTSYPDALPPDTEPEHIGVNTDQGTDPVETDQGDEENEGRLYGTPDDVSSDGYGDEIEYDQQQDTLDNIVEP